jgi:hypothetical protein
MAREECELEPVEELLNIFDIFRKWSRSEGDEKSEKYKASE